MTKIIKIETLSERFDGRVFSEAQLQPDPTLVAEGWERRFTADPQRTKEAMELYDQLGYEVRAESLQPEQLIDDCEGCRSQVLLEFKTIYTRKKKD